MAVRKAARFLAPLALAAAVAGTYVVVHQTLQRTKHSTTPTQSTGQAATRPGHAKHAVHGHPRFYVVKAGDNLSQIAFKTGVSLGTIERLNPSVDPSALQPGHRLRLR